MKKLLAAIWILVLLVSSASAAAPDQAEEIARAGNGKEQRVPQHLRGL